jgi:hypothetical protein
MAGNIYPCSGMAVEQEEYGVAATAATAVTGRGPEEVVYFGGGGTTSRPGTGAGSQEVVYLGRPISLSPRPATPARVVVYFGRGTPSPRPGTPTREVTYHDRGSSSGNNLWGRHPRVARPLYVYTGDEPSPPYVYPDTIGQRP